MAWSREVEQASWIGELLSPFSAGVVTSVIPAGFDAYARILHPAEVIETNGPRSVRWAEVAKWSNLPLGPGSQFHDIALPEKDPGIPAPWTGQGPREGTLSDDDASALVDLLAEHTNTPQRCWFCIWSGYGWDNATLLTFLDDDPVKLDDPIPESVRSGPRVEMPHREYFIYSGPIDQALAFVGTKQQTPNLWWPDDRAWCVASEIDLPWTYVGGRSELIKQLINHRNIEAQPAAPDETIQRKGERGPGRFDQK